LAGVRDVVVLDRAGVGSGASSIQPGGVRQQWGSRVNCLLARESFAFYRDISEHLDLAVPATLDRGGYVFVALLAETLSRLEGNRVLQNECGIPSVALSPEEVGDLVPGLDPSSLLGGFFCAEDGYFDRPQAVIAGFAASAVARGATIDTQEVVELSADGAGWLVRVRAGVSLRAQHVVVAAGADSTELVAPLGVALPIVRSARHLFYSEPIRERILEPLVVSPDQRFAAKQLADGSVLASDLSAQGDSTSIPQWLSRVRAGVETLLPILEYVTFPIHVEGYYDLTPDSQAVLGGVAGPPGLWIAAGLSGRGFMMAPAIGRLLAEGIAHGKHDPLLDALSVSRFAGDNLIPEPQVV
jgi:sarcosine oxidase subunit beta